ncbi:hypothetical protein BD324DRAFT_652203 [Kockovaella imperatae]|uniref:Mitochondrial ribosomal protein L28-domain-containing protein n=1 Tax=Kockovaella imperatae TaxID=4999 RepID=A0A1Y1UF03_9TREE|nr:hypothetical protein BD324DRAFT_652203 [Kockovaella imperatae]ORX35655.1 hypothetical protein BD324DRAFT_652203 [Kockovaella imperatae]
MSVISLNCVASSSRHTLSSSCAPLRNYVTKAEKLKAARVAPKKVSTYVDPRFAPAPSDLKIDAMRASLYPDNSFDRKSVSPVGAHYPNVEEKVRAVIGSPEMYETIDRAWKLHRRIEMAKRRDSLEAQFRAMEEACDELDIITGGPEIPVSDASNDPKNYLKEKQLTGVAIYPRRLYNAAMVKPDSFAAPRLQGKKIPLEARWKEARLDGLIPREAWVPVDSKGKGWDYGWERPSEKE